MIRIFINSEPTSLGLDLKAFKVEEENLKSIRICITDTEAELFKAGGLWAIYKLRLEAYKQYVENYFYFGCLVEGKDGFTVFTARFLKNGSGYPDRLKLPPVEELKEMHLL